MINAVVFHAKSAKFKPAAGTSVCMFVPCLKKFSPEIFFFTQSIKVPGRLIDDLKLKDPINVAVSKFVSFSSLLPTKDE